LTDLLVDEFKVRGGCELIVCCST